MIHQVYIFLVNGALSALAVFALFKFQDRLQKILFVVLCGASMLWSSLVILARFPGFARDEHLLIFRLIFFAGAVLLMTLTFFMVHFARPELARKKWHWGLQIHMLLVSFLSFGDFYVTDVQPGVFGPGPVYHRPGQIYYNAAIILTAVVYFLIMRRTSHETESGILRYQLKRLFHVFLAGFTLIVFTNMVYPVVTGRSDLSSAGPAWVFIFIFGIWHMVVRGRRNYLAGPIFERPANDRLFSTELDASRRAVEVLTRVLSTDGTDAHMVSLGGDRLLLEKKKGRYDDPLDVVAKSDLDPYLGGVISSAADALQENMRLRASLLLAHRKMDEEGVTLTLERADDEAVRLAGFIENYKEIVHENFILKVSLDYYENHSRRLGIPPPPFSQG